MTRIGMGLVGAGFVGPHHIDAVRRLGFVDVVAIACSSDESGREKAEALGVRKGYGSYQALLDDPDVQVVHIATPNHLHYEVTSAALAKGRHVVSDKPLAMTSAQAKRLVSEAHRAGVVAAVTFNYRGNPLVQQARLAISEATSVRRIFCTAITCRTGSSTTRTTRGASTRKREARLPRWPTSERTGVTWPNTSPACGSPTSSETSPPS